MIENLMKHYTFCKDKYVEKVYFHKWYMSICIQKYGKEKKKFVYLYLQITTFHYSYYIHKND